MLKENDCERIKVVGDKVAEINENLQRTQVYERAIRRII